MQKVRQQGAQAVEFALVLPFLILILFAILDFGILAYDKAIVTNASREAARNAIALTAATWNTTAIKQVACDYAKTTLITVSSQSRTTTCSGAADPVISVSPAAMPAFGSPVTVTVSFAVKGFSMGTWFSLGTGPSTIGSAITISATTVMNHE